MLRLIALSAIIIPPNRQRREFKLDSIMELAASIERKGLLHAPILRQEGEGYALVAGERRLRAITDIYQREETFSYDSNPIPAGFVPYTLLSELDPLAAEEAELEENIARVDLTWQERAAAHARIHVLRTAQAVQSNLPPRTVKDTSIEVRGSGEGAAHETTRRELIIAKHLENPAIKNAKTVDEAFKILKREEMRTKATQLAETVGRTYSSDVHQAFNADSLDWMAQAQAETFDVILTDPPYGMGADDFGDSGGMAAGAHTYKDDIDTFKTCLFALAKEGFRITKPAAHLYMFCDIDKFHLAKVCFQTNGWKVFRTPFIWLKRGGFRTPWVDEGPQRKYECILYATKGDRKVKVLLGDVLDHMPDENLGHMAQKPVELFIDLLKRSVSPGDTVLDPFAGSGPIFPAAHELKCKAIGIEKDPAHYGLILKRLEQLKAQGDLFK